MSDLSTPGTRRRSIAITATAWWYGHTRERQRTLRLWGGVLIGLTTMTLICCALRTIA